ncbi:MBL fold metallo-hydrolase [Oceanirhabdus sp. W0125-5]|uniref:MBL fold metallo-hydrolase n=1 Tax=Oceanirhabdus sp. W0125-5 TaxID=2999116 RepID=UPI0022F34154|nr:MBL fold metallo-hydrolase [Oceanirhabdus sp. W0125-5]WBW98307.1 MBL fold metallo-hydrolase [Oceanirhabdus sp. W0125-5]
MNIFYIGHSTYYIDTGEFKIITDPGEFVMNKLKNKEMYEKFTHVTISHSHFDHSFINEFSEEITIINKCDVYENNSLRIHGFKSYHDNFKGYKRGENIIYLIHAEGTTLCHLGDLGHSLDDNFIDKLGNIDILFIPVGGNITIDGELASNLVHRLSPKIVLPMHYRTPDFPLPIEGLEKFLYEVNLPIIHKKSLEIYSNDLKNEKTKIILLNELS